MVSFRWRLRSPESFDGYGKGQKLGMGVYSCLLLQLALSGSVSIDFISTVVDPCRNTCGH